MCIRDRFRTPDFDKISARLKAKVIFDGRNLFDLEQIRLLGCLLYTSDAADERSSVDLGGRRIIKKKNKKRACGVGTSRYKNKHK